MRTVLKLIFVSLMMIIFVGCTETNMENSPAESYEIIFATDIHYFSPELAEEGSTFYEMMKSSDGKMTEYAVEITSAFVGEIISLRPDALILGGDLTFNGEKQSHNELAKILEPLKDAGIPVLIVPGNHDINRKTYRYTEQGAVITESITANEFWNIYKSFGADSAVSFDKNSLSYLYQLSADFYILMIDTTQSGKEQGSGGKVGSATMEWIEKCLSQKSGATVITVMHHNLMPHNPMFTLGFVIEDYQPLVDLFEQYGVSLNLSGHMHAQHIAQSQNQRVYDIANNALSVYPNYYGKLSISTDRVINYQATRLNVSGWAGDNGSTDENLLNFEQYSLDFFNGCSSSQTTRFLSDYSDIISAEDIGKMAEFAQALNANYFAGQPEEISTEPYELWRKYCPSEPYNHYFEGIMEDKTYSVSLTIP